MTPPSRRVVVTGLAAFTPLGNTLEESWEGLLAGRSGIAPLTLFDSREHQTRIAGELKNFVPHESIPFKQAKRMDRFTQIAVTAGLQLMENAKFAISEEDSREVGVILGCGLGGLETIETFHGRLSKQGPKKISPFYIPMLIANMAPAQIAISIGARGVNLATTSACASGLHGIGCAYADILAGRSKAIITGGVEATITAMAVSGFNAMKALSTRNDEPEKASRPFDRDRDGFVMSEGCGLLLLEELDHALARGAKILAEVIGYGASCDAGHMVAPDEDGRGMSLAMQNALRDAGIAPERVDHINAHGTSTPLNDISETRAIKAVFGSHANKLTISANKSQIGHMLGAAGGAESVFTVLTIAKGMIPGTMNLENPDDECDLNYMAGRAAPGRVNYAMCNSFGFGGTNASIVFKRFE
ncbi:MAG: beta-ketoacyl-[acyl-carrier-protein] synthase II [Deltaproteobacteria bacterium]|nr:beta-ketoacyl-[acyl-carrier-protein] synthase II [Deltaproteobacteria bacterium]